MDDGFWITLVPFARPKRRLLDAGQFAGRTMPADCVGYDVVSHTSILINAQNI